MLNADSTLNLSMFSDALAASTFLGRWTPSSKPVTLKFGYDQTEQVKEVGEAEAGVIEARDNPLVHYLRIPVKRLFSRV